MIGELRKQYCSETLVMCRKNMKRLNNGTSLNHELPNSEWATACNLADRVRYTRIKNII